MKAVMLVLVVALSGCFGSLPETLGGPDIEFHEALVWPEPDRLIVQVSYVEGREPSQYTLDKLEAVLDEHTDKKAITIRQPELIAGGDGRADQEWTVDEIREIHARHYLLPDANRYASGGQMYIHFLFLNGYGEREGRQFVGLAVRPDFYVFPDVGDMSIGLTQPVILGAPHPAPYEVEAAIAIHELGHGLGLVGRGAPETADRKTTEDDDPCACHSQNRESVMFPAVENINLERFLQDQEWVKQDFDATDIADLAALRARY